jgi:polyribonucleotide nucleotidyltransferase
MSEVKRFEKEWGGKPLVIETGRYAQRASGTCTVQYGDSLILATAVISKSPREGIDFFPLMVDYEEKLYAAGKIKSSRFIKREGRPNDEAVMTGRMIDRALRPLFPQKVRHEVQVVVEVLSADLENNTDMLGMIGASCALAMSEIPWNGPIASVRVGRVDGQFVVNPTMKQIDEQSDMDVIVAGTTERVIMLEANGSQIPEDDMYEAIMLGQKELATPIALINEVVAALGKEKLDEATLKGGDPDETEEQKAEMAAHQQLAEEFLKDRLPAAMFATPDASKTDRFEALYKVKAECDEYLKEKQVGKDKRKKILDGFYGMIGAAATKAILEEDKRVDGRKLNEVRSIACEVDLLPRTHGSGLFNRGETQVLSSVTLGGPGDAQILDGMDQDNLKKRYMHHYNFPPFSVAETGRLGGGGRREIGHGGLAERALIPVLPSKEDFPYVTRVVSEVLSSNGSSSQASICGSTLALMDAGVPLKNPVAGVAMGLASNPDMSQWKVLSDIQDVEDGDGGMDFKIGGTKDGICTIQLDTKTIGLTPDIVRQTLDQGKEARLYILEEMAKTIAEPRAEMKPHAPRIVSLKIEVDQIRDVIGPGGKVINEIVDTCNVKMDVEDDGTVTITSADREGLDKAVGMVRRITKKVEVGEMFEGKVVRIMDFGAFVELTPSQDGMVHISDLAPWHVNKVTDIVNMNDVIPVKVVKIDELGRVNLSHKDAMKELGREQKKPEGYVSDPPRAPRPGGGRPGGGRSGGGRPGGGRDRGPRH